MNSFHLPPDSARALRGPRVNTSEDVLSPHLTSDRHLTDDDFVEFAQESPGVVARVDQHLQTCSTCAKLLDDFLEQSDRIVSELLPYSEEWTNWVSIESSCAAQEALFPLAVGLPTLWLNRVSSALHDKAKTVPLTIVLWAPAEDHVSEVRAIADGLVDRMVSDGHTIVPYTGERASETGALEAVVSAAHVDLVVMLRGDTRTLTANDLTTLERHLNRMIVVTNAGDGDDAELRRLEDRGLMIVPLGEHPRAIEAATEDTMQMVQKARERVIRYRTRSSSHRDYPLLLTPQPILQSPRHCLTLLRLESVGFATGSDLEHLSSPNLDATLLDLEINDLVYRSQNDVLSVTSGGRRLLDKFELHDLTIEQILDAICGACWPLRSELRRVLHVFRQRDFRHYLWSVWSLRVWLVLEQHDFSQAMEPSTAGLAVFMRGLWKSVAGDTSSPLKAEVARYDISRLTDDRWRLATDDIDVTLLERIVLELAAMSGLPWKPDRLSPLSSYIRAAASFREEVLLDLTSYRNSLLDVKRRSAVTSQQTTVAPRGYFGGTARLYQPRADPRQDCKHDAEQWCDEVFLQAISGGNARAQLTIYRALAEGASVQQLELAISLLEDCSRPSCDIDLYTTKQVEKISRSLRACLEWKRATNRQLPLWLVLYYRRIFARLRRIADENVDLSVNVGDARSDAALKMATRALADLRTLSRILSSNGEAVTSLEGLKKNIQQSTEWRTAPRTA